MSKITKIHLAVSIVLWILGLLMPIFHFWETDLYYLAGYGVYFYCWIPISVGIYAFLTVHSIKDRVWRKKSLMQNIMIADVTAVITCLSYFVF